MDINFLNLHTEAYLDWKVKIEIQQVVIQVTGNQVEQRIYHKLTKRMAGHH